MKVDINKNKIPTADKLRRLYLVQKLSSPNIARIYGRDPKYVRTLLRKCGVPVRTKSEARKLLFNIHIPKRELKKMYLSKRMSSPEIAKKFKCNPGLIRNRLREYKIPVRSIQEALPLSNRPKYPQHNFSGDLEEKSYLMGFSKGDLHVYARSKNSATIFINVSSTKQELIEIVEESFLPYGHIWKSKPNKDGIIYIHCSLNRTFDFLLGKKDLIESWVLKNKNYKTYCQTETDENCKT